jgi:hypothetical protein
VKSGGSATGRKQLHALLVRVLNAANELKSGTLRRRLMWLLVHNLALHAGDGEDEGSEQSMLLLQRMVALVRSFSTRHRWRSSLSLKSCACTFLWTLV